MDAVSTREGLIFLGMPAGQSAGSRAQESREGRWTLGGPGARLLALLTAGRPALDTALGLSGCCSSPGDSLGIR